MQGFIATITLVILAIGSLAMSLVTINTAILYADGVYSRERRIQRKLNDTSCLETASLISAKDIYWSKDVYLSDFDCVISSNIL